MPLETFGQRVKQARLNLSARMGRQIAQSEIAEAVGVHQVTLGEWERGKSEPKLETIERLAAVLAVSAAWLAFGEGEADITPMAPVSMFKTGEQIDAERAAEEAAKQGRSA